MEPASLSVHHTSETRSPDGQSPDGRQNLSCAILSMLIQKQEVGTEPNFFIYDKLPEVVVAGLWAMVILYLY